ncbi:MAG: polysaccharide deacetylase family protein [Pseudomonadota bacterium]
MALTVFMYHEVVRAEQLAAIEGKINTNYVVTYDVFEAHLRAIRDAGATVVTPDEISERLAAGKQLPDKAVLITFDDGFLGNYELALPLLQTFGFPATFYVVTNKIGDERMLSWDQLREMHAAGMTVGSHTVSHPLLSTLGKEETRQELERSRDVIAEQLRTETRHLSLPNGDTNEWYRDLAAELAYATVCGSEFGRNASSIDPLFIERIAIKKTTSAAQITKYVEGDWATFAMSAVKSLLKKLLVGLLSKRRYDALYNRLFGVEDQRKGSAY